MRLLLAALCGVLCLFFHSAHGQTCSYITNCKNCTTSPAAKCLTCDQGKVINTDKTKCEDCPPNCLNCTYNHFEKKAECQVCKDEYYLSSGKCEQCLGDCKMCKDAITCETCSPGYQKQVPSATNPATCQGCSSNCDACKVPGKCDTCSKGYYRTGTTCTACPGNCLTCTSATSCSECPSDNDYWDSTGKQCTTCGTKCTDCKLAEGCKKCSVGYYVKNKICVEAANCELAEDAVTDEVGCNRCKPGFVVLSGTCKACTSLPTSACAACKTATRGKVWDTSDSICKFCPKNCLGCDEDGDCTTCAPGFKVDTSTDPESCKGDGCRESIGRM